MTKVRSGPPATAAPGRCPARGLRRRLHRDHGAIELDATHANIWISRSSTSGRRDTCRLHELSDYTDALISARSCTRRRRTYRCPYTIGDGPAEVGAHAEATFMSALSGCGVEVVEARAVPRAIDQGVQLWTAASPARVSYLHTVGQNQAGLSAGHLYTLGIDA